MAVDQLKEALVPLRVALKYERVTGRGVPPLPVKKSLKEVKPVPVTEVAVEEVVNPDLSQAELAYFWRTSEPVVGGTDEVSRVDEGEGGVVTGEGQPGTGVSVQDRLM